MKITVPHTVQPMSMNDFKTFVKAHYNVKANWDNQGMWTFESNDIRAMELVIQDLMQLKPLA